MQMNYSDYYKQYLQTELNKRCERNPCYSLRAFSRSLSVDVASMSRVLSHKQTITLKTAQKMCEGLKLDQNERNNFIYSVIEDRRILYGQKVKKIKKQAVTSELFFQI
jgi:hypothetical protein